MTNRVEFNVFMAKKNLKYSELAKMLNISKTSLSKKINGKVEFKQTEIMEIKDKTNMSDDEFLDIFFSH